MDVFEVITNRRSHRGEFRNTPIVDVDLEKIIEAARWAPSPFNVQPWELLIIQEEHSKIELAKLTEQAIIKQFKDKQFLEDNARWMCTSDEEWQTRGDGVLLSDHVTLPKLFQTLPKKLTGNILRALLNNISSLSILGHLGIGKMPAKEIAIQVEESPLLILVVMNTKRRPPGDGGNRWMWLSVGMFIQNMLLAASSLNIGIQFISAPLESDEDREKIRTLFNFGENHEVMTLLRLGYMNSDDVNSVRINSSEFIHYEKYMD
ncbi:nitroreductase family protein [Candidatus Poribacteria bacterium]|nr:nitroreductase family protein [Candidatus Poribacteria bacterium]